MHIILIYDVNVDRVNKVMKTCREYLDHIQNSVFEGDIKESTLRDLKNRIIDIIEEDEDSVIIFKLWNTNFKKESIGVEKNPDNNII